MSDRWKCDVCGYVHSGDTPPGNCPVCGVDRELFSAMESVAAEPPAPAARSWRCSVCGYEHSGDAPPDACPVCSVEASLFDAVGGEPAEAPGEGRGGVLVIVGAGVAGTTAAEGARRTDPSLRIVLISGEPVLPYYRLNLTRFLAGEVDEAALAMCGRQWLDDQGVEWIEGEVVAIHRGERTLALRDGSQLSYDRLILATGSHPFVPPMAGVDLDGVFTLRTLQDARGIVERAGSGSRCVCIGGGLLGLETAGALAGRGLSVSVLEGHGWLLPRQLAEPAGRMLQDELEGLGIAVHGPARARELAGEGRVTGVVLGDGRELAADLVVIATGVRPNSHLARRCDLTVRSGVIVDDRMATTDPAIFAAGDVAEHGGRVYGIWPASFSQGEVAGINAAGGSAAFPGIAPANSLKVLKTDIYSIGEILPGDASYQVLEERTADTYVRLVVRDGVLVGANVLGRPELANPVRDAVESGANLATLAEITRRLPSLLGS